MIRGANDNGKHAPRLAAGTCPECGKPADPAYKPFCSKRCADIDLNRWFTGGYAIPVVEEDKSANGDEDDEG